jgi:hypothetical protein
MIRFVTRKKLLTARQKLDSAWQKSMRYGRETSFFMLIAIIGLAYGEPTSMPAAWKGVLEGCLGVCPLVHECLRRAAQLAQTCLCCLFVRVPDLQVSVYLEPSAPLPPTRSLGGAHHPAMRNGVLLCRMGALAILLHLQLRAPLGDRRHRLRLRLPPDALVPLHNGTFHGWGGLGFTLEFARAGRFRV